MSLAEEFSLERLETLAYGRRHEEAASEMFRLLIHLDEHGGQLGDIGAIPSGPTAGDERDAHLTLRITSALTALFADPAFQFSDSGFLKLIPFQRSLATLFGASPFGNADHVMQRFGGARHDRLKSCLLHFPDSGIALQPESLWREDKRIAASLFLALLSTRIMASEEARQKREQLLAWLPARLVELPFDDLPIQILHDVWMHCSYADGAGKHAIKGAINEIVRAKILASGFGDLREGGPPRRPKPVVMCILEWFYASHPIYRTHSISMEALKAKYHLIGVSLQGLSDDMSRRVFDEVVVVPPTHGILDTLNVVTRLAESVRPDLVYYPSIGMLAETIFLANIRLAPIQMAALGHPATTQSRFIDYVLVEEDYIGDPACFSESVVALPRESIPYRPRADSPKIVPAVRSAAACVRIAVAASVMKINSGFLQSLRDIAERAKPPVEFHFLVGGAVGLGKTHLQNLIERALPHRARVYPHLDYAPYLEIIDSCDMFLNPFPFGNTNGIVDTVRQGLPGVCLTGAEVHSHIDEGLFRRLGLPDKLIARTIEEYVRAALELVENSDYREELSRKLLQRNPDAILFQGNAALFLNAVEWLQNNDAAHRSSNTRLLHPPREIRTPAQATAVST